MAKAATCTGKAIVLSMIALFFLSVSLFGKAENDHNRDIAQVFFVDQAYYSDSHIGNCREMCALTSAVHFCLDYMAGNESSGKRLLQNIQNLPFDLSGLYKKNYLYVNLNEADSNIANSIFDPIDGFCLISKTPGGNTHEKYTHMGWMYYDNKSDYPLSVIYETYATQWYIRKLLYQKVVNKIFDFGILDEYLSETQIELRLQKYGQIHVSKLQPITRIQYTADTKSSSFAAILYYIHILSDIAGNTDGTSDTRMNISELSEDLELRLKKVIGESKYDSASNIKSTLFAGKNAKSVSNSTARRYAEKILDAFHKEFAYLISDESFYKDTALKKYLDDVQQISD